MTGGLARGILSRSAGSVRAVQRAGRGWVRRRSTILGVALAAVVTLFAASCVTPPGGGSIAGVRTWDPSVTDSAINPDPASPSFSLVPSTTPRGQLAVILAGTGAGPLAHTKLGQRLAGQGFHVIGLRYPSGVGTAGACPASVQTTFPDCHRALRGELSFGESVAGPAGPQDHPSLSIDAANSLTNRLIKQVDHLHALFPTEGWDQFQQSSGGSCTQVDPTYGGCALDWSNMVLMGHSQGAGLALFLSKYHDVARVGMLSGTADVFAPSGGPISVAPWITEGGFATATSDIASLIHTADPAREDHRAVATALGLTGPETSIDSNARPYGGVQRLSTSITPACPLGSSQAHSATATDLCATAAVHPAWEYLATGT